MPYADPVRRREYAKAYRRTHAERIRELCDEWRARDPEHARGLQRERERRHRANNPSLAKARAQRYGTAHPDREAARDRRYRIEHPETIRAKKHRRRARELASEGRFSAAEWIALKVYYEHKCLACGAAGRQLQPDHVVPLARGGVNTIDNIQPLCGPCNAKKNDKTIDYRASAV